MKACDLPTSLMIGEVAFRIRCGWRAILDIFSAQSDPDMDPEMCNEVLLKIFYPDWQQIPQYMIPEALKKAQEFMDCGHLPSEIPKPRLVDWEQDAAIIFPSINKVAGREVRLDPEIHWWTFHGWYMAIEGGLFSTVLHIRQKQAKGKPLDKWDKEFFQDNRELVEIKKPLTAEDRAAQAYFDKWLK